MNSQDAPSVSDAEGQATTGADRSLLAIVLVLLSTVFFAGGDVGAKLLRETAPGELAVWLRYFFYLIIALAYGYYRHGTAIFHPASPKLQLGRGLATVGSTIFFISGLGYLDVPSNTAIHFISPIFVMALSVVFLGEVVGIRRWLAALVGFAGVLLVVRPGSSAFQFAALLPVCSAFSWALSALFTRMNSRDAGELTFFWTGVIGLTVATALALPVWRMPEGIEWAYGLGGSLCFVTAQLLIIAAFRMAPLSLLAPISYVQLISAGVLSYIFYGTLPSAWTLGGSVLIAGSGLYSSHRERVKRRPPTALPLE